VAGILFAGLGTGSHRVQPARQPDGRNARRTVSPVSGRHRIQYRISANPSLMTGERAGYKKFAVGFIPNVELQSGNGRVNFHILIILSTQLVRVHDQHLSKGYYGKDHYQIQKSR
jgi:hypothetical protein